MVFLHNQLKLKSLRKTLRKNQTDAEARLWHVLRSRQLRGVKFHRQYNIGSSILDFYAPSMKLAIELDGGQHNTETVKANDKSRSDYLQRFGIRVVRFWDNEVLRNTRGVLEVIASHINSSQPPL